MIDVSSKTQYSTEVIDETDDSLMFEDESTGQLYEAQEVGESEYLIGLFGTLNEPDENNSIVERLEVESSKSTEEIAQELAVNYDNPSIDPLKQRRNNLLEMYQQRELHETVEQDHANTNNPHSNDQIEVLP